MRFASATVCTPLMTNGPCPRRSDPFQVGHRHRGVEELVHQLRDRPIPRAQGREGERTRAQQVDPPRGVRGDVRPRSSASASAGWRNRCARRANACRNGRVNGEHQRLETCIARTAHQLLAGTAIPPHVQLKPLARVRRCGCDVLDRRRAQRGERVWDTDRCGDSRNRTLAFMVHQAREAGGSKRKRQRGRLARASTWSCRRARRPAGPTARTPDRGTDVARGAG